MTRASAPTAPGDLARRLFGTTFQNPLLLAAGTCGFGEEISDVVDVEALGGIVTKSVTLEPRFGNPAPRVAEFGAGMINSIGLTNPGLEAVRREKLPWIERNLRRARVLVSVAGHTAQEYEQIVAGLDDAPGFVGFELNLSCPNDDRLGGRPFALDPEALARTVALCRARTERPLLVKLAPNDPELARTVRVAESSGADGLTLVNTLPGLILDPDSGRAALGAGEGGVSGPALRGAAVRAVRVARDGSALPLVGVGGISRTEHALQFLHAGAALVQVGTAGFADPRTAERIVRGLERRARTGRLPALEIRKGPERGGSAAQGRSERDAPDTGAPAPERSREVEAAHEEPAGEVSWRR